MIRSFSLILFTIFFQALMAQDTINITDNHGLKQGFWRKSDTAGQTVYQGRFKDGKPTGEFRYFYPNGKLKTIAVVSDNGKRAVTTSYFTNGRKMAAGNYLNEKKDSIWQFFSESNGTLVSEERYNNGLIEGTSKVFYPDGGSSEMHYYKKGIRDGLWEQYYTDGMLKLRGAYKGGEKQGQFKTFFNSGQVMISGQYITGHQDGTWIYYTEKGEISKREFYNKGTLLKVEESGIK